MKLNIIIQIFVVSITKSGGQVRETDFSLFSNPRISEFYKIGSLISKLNLQFCSIVEVGEGFCALFVEFRSNFKSTVVSPENVAEVFLGMCQCRALRNWQFCSNQLQLFRPQDCKFREATANSSGRVHRRLCDVTAMQRWNGDCNCSYEFAGKHLNPVTGFSTCFVSPLPNSICSPRNVCGVHRCNTRTLFQLHLVRCDPFCKGKAPFCEDGGLRTAQYRTTNAVWSPWSTIQCNTTSGFLESNSVCIDSVTRKAPAFDCIGPGIYCCPSIYPECKCEIQLGTVMKVKRLLSPCRNQTLSSDPIFDQGLIHRSLRTVDGKNYSSEWDSPTFNDPFQTEMKTSPGYKPENKSEILLRDKSNRQNINKGLATNQSHNTMGSCDVDHPQAMEKNYSNKNSLVPISIASILKTVMGHKNMKSSQNMKQLQSSILKKVEDNSSNIYRPEISSPERFDNAKGQANGFQIICNKMYHSSQSDQMKHGFKSNGYDSNRYKNNSEQFSDQINYQNDPQQAADQRRYQNNLQATSRTKYLNNFYQAIDQNNSDKFKNNLQANDKNDFEYSLLLTDQNKHRNASQNILCQAKNKNQNNLQLANALNRNQNNFHPAIDLIYKRPSVEDQTSKKLPSNMHELISIVHHSNANSTEDQRYSTSKVIFQNNYKFRVNSDPGKINDRKSWGDNPNQPLVAINPQIISNAPDRINNIFQEQSVNSWHVNGNSFQIMQPNQIHITTAKSEYNTQPFIKSDNFSSEKNKSDSMKYQEIGQLNNSSVQKECVSNQTLNDFYNHPERNTSMQNNTANQEPRLNNEFPTTVKMNGSIACSPLFNFINQSNNDKAKMLVTYSYEENGNKKNQMLIQMIKKHIFDLVTNITNQTVCDRSRYNCELKNHLFVVYQIMPFLKEVIINSLHEPREPSSTTFDASNKMIYIDQNATPLYTLINNEPPTTPSVNSDIQIIDYANKLYEVYKNIKSPLIINYYVSQPKKRLPGNSDQNSKVNNTVEKDNKFIFE